MFYHIYPNFEFLQAAALFLDLGEHVFCFNSLDLCPMYKEFSDILGWNLVEFDAMILIDSEFQYLVRESTLLYLSPRLLDTLITLKSSLKCFMFLK